MKAANVEKTGASAKEAGVGGRSDWGRRTSPAEGKLLQRCEPTADRGVRDLGLVERRKERELADGEAGKEATGEHHLAVLGGLWTAARGAMAQSMLQAARHASTG
jgi:hypothetical protein